MDYETIVEILRVFREENPHWNAVPGVRGIRLIFKRNRPVLELQVTDETSLRGASFLPREFVFAARGDRITLPVTRRISPIPVAHGVSKRVSRRGSLRRAGQ